jgi:hypothetical protein
MRQNGTLLNGLPLQPNAAAPLGSATRLNVEVSLTFLSAGAFLRWLMKVVDAGVTSAAGAPGHRSGTLTPTRSPPRRAAGRLPV